MNIKNFLIILGGFVLVSIFAIGLFLVYFFLGYSLGWSVELITSHKEILGMDIKLFSGYFILGIGLILSFVQTIKSK
jgi:hypothetical protein